MAIALAGLQNFGHPLDGAGLFNSQINSENDNILYRDIPFIYKEINFVSVCIKEGDMYCALFIGPRTKFNPRKICFPTL